ncbi:unnamed protein product [Pneumocystis jirovecii]|uniref:Uncharacterized protein n=1 Tax=Pneumocystis jirovecii TaxID=42068 RepID=L0PFW5_PNEJI|nr:unnamed protein product [Pneumocystis jirovecii]
MKVSRAKTSETRGEANGIEHPIAAIIDVVSAVGRGVQVIMGTIGIREVVAHAGALRHELRRGICDGNSRFGAKICTRNDLYDMIAWEVKKRDFLQGYS